MDNEFQTFASTTAPATVSVVTVGSDSSSHAQVHHHVISNITLMEDPELQAVSDEDSGLDDSMSSKSSHTSTDTNCSSTNDDGRGAIFQHQNLHTTTLLYCSDTGCCLQQPQLPPTKKRVRWEKIQYRDYALVVGDHPLCQDGLPVSLAWQYNDNATPSISLVLHQQQKHYEHAKRQNDSDGDDHDHVAAYRSAAYVFPRRLTYEERQRRLQTVSDLTLEQIKNDEIELVVRTLNENFFRRGCSGDDSDDDDDASAGRCVSQGCDEDEPLPVSSNGNEFDLDGDSIMFDGDIDKNNETMKQMLLFTDNDEDSDDNDEDLFDMSSFDWGCR